MRKKLNVTLPWLRGEIRGDRRKPPGFQDSVAVAWPYTNRDPIVFVVLVSWPSLPWRVDSDSPHFVKHPPKKYSQQPLYYSYKSRFWNRAVLFQCVFGQNDLLQILVLNLFLVPLYGFIVAVQHPDYLALGEIISVINIFNTL